MTERNRKAEASNDSEIRAMMMIKRALDPLDRSARHRVLQWAEGRYVREALPDLDPQFMTRFTDTMAEAARQMGSVTPLDLIRAANEFARHRDEVEAGEDAAATREP